MTEDKTRQLENRIDKLESTIDKMMPSRRDTLKMGGAALVGGAAISGKASAGTNQVGTIGSASQPVDLESEDINNADTVTTDTLNSTTVDNSGTVTTQDIVVNGTATGPFGGGGVVLESGDSITVSTIELDTTSLSFVTLYDGSSKDVLGGTVVGGASNDFLYEFADSTTLARNSSGTSYTSDFARLARHEDTGGGEAEVTFLPPAKNVVNIKVGSELIADNDLGAEVILKD